MLVTTDTHEELARKLAYIQPDWRSIVSRVTPDDLRAWERAVKKNESHVISGRIAELHLDDALERIAKTTPGITLNPIPSGTLSQQYQFQEREGRFYARIGFNDKVEYDAVLLVEDVPTVIEIKNRHCEDIEKRLFSDENVTRIMEPLRAHFKTDKTAFICILPVTKLSQPKQRFIAQGGMIIPFYTRAASFREESYNRVCKLFPHIAAAI